LFEFYAILKQLWLLWFMLLFTGIAAWAWWPSRKGSFQQHALIPLRDEASQGLERKR
jgi:cytochrome c oxidase cbb3-type subunit 4